MVTTNAKGGQASDTRVQAQQAAKVTAKTAATVSSKAVAKPAQPAPAVVVSLKKNQAPTLPTYNAAAKTNTPAAVAKPTTPQPAAAKAPAAASPAKPATPQPAAAAKSAAQAPAAEGALYTTGNGAVMVDIKASDSGYENKIYWSADNWKTRNYLGVDNHTGSFNIGSFAAGTKIDFAVDNGQGDFFKASGGNTDGFQHARVSSDASGMTVGFEDLRGGGDQDFNDAIISVSGLSTSTPTPVEAPKAAPAPAQPPKAEVTPPKATTPTAPVVTTPAPVVSKPNPAPATPAKPETKDNRSGLGDGTNPGQGGGRVNSPNTGTENPNNATKATKKAPTSAQLAQLAANQRAALLKAQTPVAQSAAKSGSAVVRKA